MCGYEPSYLTSILLVDILSINVTFIPFKTKIRIYQSNNFNTFKFKNIPTNTLYYKTKLKKKH